MVTMKLRPVRIDEKPAMKMPSAVSDHVRVRIRAAERRVERPAGIDAARDDRAYSVKIAADDVEVPAQQVDSRKRQIRAPIMIGTRKLPSTAGIDGTRKKNTMMMPCIVNSLL